MAGDSRLHDESLPKRSTYVLRTPWYNAPQQPLLFIPHPEGPKYPSMRYIWFLYILGIVIRILGI